VVNFALAVVCAAIGLVALPIVFGSLATTWSTPVWLLSAGLLSVALLALLPRLSSPLAKKIDAFARSATPSQTRLAAQLTVLSAILVTVQAILRRPLAFLVGGQSGSIAYEAAIAATALTLVLALLVWLYQTARPLLQTVTLQAIDTAFPTVAPAATSEPTRTVAPIAPPTMRAPTVTYDEPTVAAAHRETDPVATLLAGTDTEATRSANREADPEATLLRGGDPDATIRAPEPRAT
jgi:hypothetical protein